MPNRPERNEVEMMVKPIRAKAKGVSAAVMLEQIATSWPGLVPAAAARLLCALLFRAPDAAQREQRETVRRRSGAVANTASGTSRICSASLTLDTKTRVNALMLRCARDT